MKINISVVLSTDGDFCLLDRDPDIREKAWLYSNNSEWYCINAHFNHENELSCKINARIFLECILCDIHVCSNHRRLIPIIYNMFDKACEFIYNSESKNHYYGCIGGNYEGTEIKVEIPEC